MLIWLFKERRTNPCIVHRYTAEGEPTAVEIHIMRDPSVDQTMSDGSPVRGNAVDVVAMTAPPGSPVFSHLPDNWETADWGRVNSGQEGYTGPRGLLYVEDGEYRNPHAVLAAAQRKILAILARAPEVVLDSSAEVPNPLASNAPAKKDDERQAGPGVIVPPPPPKAVHDPADLNKDGVIDKDERKAARHTAKKETPKE